MSEAAGALNWVDWLILGILLLSAVVSLLRGLVVEVASLAIAIGGALLAFHFASPVAEQFLLGVEVPALRTGIAALAIYVITSLLGALLLYLLKRLIQTAGLSGTDRMLGLVFGVARGALVVVALYWVGQLLRLPQSDWWQQSLLMPEVDRASSALLVFLPDNVREMIAHPESLMQSMPAPPLPGPEAIEGGLQPAAAEDPDPDQAVEAAEQGGAGR